MHSAGGRLVSFAVVASLAGCAVYDDAKVARRSHDGSAPADDAQLDRGTFAGPGPGGAVTVGTSGGAGGSRSDDGGAGAGGMFDEPDADPSAADADADEPRTGEKGDVAGDADVDADSGADVGTVDARAPCPTHVELAGETETARHGDDTSGILSRDRCPEGQVVIGYLGSVDSREPASIGELAALCGTVALDPSSCSISIWPGALLPQRGTIGDTPFSQVCPANQVIVGSFGRAADFFDRVGFSCASLRVEATSAGYRVSLGPKTMLSAAGGDGGQPFDEPCPTRQLARGSSTRVVEGIVGAFGLLCSTPTLAP